MLNRINKLANTTVNQALVVADTFVGVSRAAAEGTAQLMFKAKKPIRDVADTGVRLNRISHKSIEKLVKVQAKAIERSVDAGAARLELAARAPSLKALVEEQVGLLPETRKRLRGDVRKTWSVLTDAGNEIGATLRGDKPAGKRKTAKKSTTTRTRRAASKKTAASKKNKVKRKNTTRKSTNRTRKAA